MPQTGDRKLTWNKPVAIAIEGADGLHLLRNYLHDKVEFQNVWLYDFMEFNAEVELDRNEQTGVNSPLNRWLKHVFNSRDLQNQVRVLGVIRDIEQIGRVAMLASVNTALAAANLPSVDLCDCVSNAPLPSHHIAAVPIAVHLMPAGADNGCLENVLLESFSGKAVQLECANAYVKCIGRIPGTSQNPNWSAKVRVRALIASSPSPGLTLGESARIGLWDFESLSKPLSKVIEFIRLLQLEATTQ